MKKKHILLSITLFVLLSCQQEPDVDPETPDTTTYQYVKTLEHFEGDDFTKFDLRGIAVDQAGNIFIGIYHYNKGGIYKYPAYTSEAWNQASAKAKLETIGTYIGTDTTDIEGFCYTNTELGEKIFFSDYGYSKIYQLNTDFNSSAQEFETGKGFFRLGSDRSGNIYNTIAGEKKIYKYSNNGTLLKTFDGEELTLFQPIRIATFAGNNIYISSTNFSEKSKSLIKLSTGDDKLNSEWDLPKGSDQYSQGFGIATDSNYLFIADDIQQKIDIYDKSNSLIDEITSLDSDDPTIGSPYELFTYTKDKVNILYILSEKENRLQIHIFKY